MADWDVVNTEPEDQGPKLTAPSSDKRLAKTISDIEAGKPAPKVTWKGQPLPGYRAPEAQTSPRDEWSVKSEMIDKGEAGQKKGFLGTLKSPLDLWRNESLPAHLGAAIAKGVFDKPIGELVASAKDEVANLSFKELWKAAKADPGQFLGELTNSIMADPYLLIVPVGLGGNVAMRMGQAAKAAGAGEKLAKGVYVAGRGLEAGAMGGAQTGVLSAGKQLDEAGVIHPQQIIADMKMGAASGAALGVIFNLGGAKLGKRPEDLYNSFKEGVAKGAKPDESLDTTLKNFGMKSAEERKAYTDELHEKATMDFANSFYEKKGPQTPTQTKKEIAAQKKAVAARMKAESAGAEVAKEEAIAREAAQAAEKARTSELLDAIKMPEKVHEAPPMDLSPAGMAAAKAGPARTAEDLIRLRAEKMKAGEQPAPKLDIKQFTTPEKAPQILTPSEMAKSDAAKWAELNKTFNEKSGTVGDVFEKQMKARGYDDPDFARLAAMEEKPKLGQGQFNQGGQIDPRLLKGMAKVGVAAAIGGYLADDPKQGAALGGALALGGMAAAKATSVMLNGLKARLAGTFKDTRYRIDGMRRDYQSTLAGMQIDIARVAHGLEKLVPDTNRRAELSHYIEGSSPELRPRSPDEVAYVKLLNDTYAALGKAGQEAGVLESLKAEGTYITHLYGATGKEANTIRARFANMSPESRFAMNRSFPTLKAAMEAGMQPLTQDSAEILRIYGNSLAKTMASNRLLAGLKNGMHPDSRPLLMPIGKLKDSAMKERFADYESVNHPQLQNFRVHPDIKSSLELLFSEDNPNAISQRLLELSAVSKRALFSFSMFHAMALTEAALASQGSILKGLKTVGQTFGRAARGKHWLEGEMGQAAEEAAKAGVVLEPKRGIDAESDIFQRVLNRTIENSRGWLSPGRAGLGALGATAGALYSPDDPLGGAIAGGAVAFGAGRKLLQAGKVVDQKLNTFLWDRLHPTYKILTFQSAKERLLRQNADLAKAGKQMMTPDEINRYAASFTNDTFGGLNWVELAEGVQNRYGRDLAMAAVSPAGRRAMSIGIMAPDWTVSTLRSITKAVPGVTQPEIAALHRSYLVNSALMYLTFGDALNMAFSGHHIWENKDPTYIDLGDGRKMQLNKHFMETFHWAQHPIKTMANKMGAIPRIVGKAAFDPYMTSPSKVAKEALSTITPIPIANVASQDEMGSGIAGFFGVPIYGKTDAQKERDKERRKEKQSETRRKKREEE